MIICAAPLLVSPEHSGSSSEMSRLIRSLRTEGQGHRNALNQGGHNCKNKVRPTLWHHFLLCYVAVHTGLNAHSEVGFDFFSFLLTQILYYDVLDT